MLREHSKVIDQLAQLFDLMMIAVAFLINIIFYRQKGVIISDIPDNYFLIFLFYILFWTLVSNANNVYGSKRLTLLRDECFNLVKSHVITTAISLMALTFLFRGLIQDRFVYYFVAFAFFLTLLIHMAERFLLERIRRSQMNVKYCLILGGGEAAQFITNQFGEHPELGYRMIGYCAPTQTDLNLPYLGDYGNLEKTLNSHIVDVVLVAESILDPEIRTCMSLVEIMGRTVLTILDDSIYHLLKYKPFNLAGMSMMINNSLQNEWQDLFKKLFDLVVSFIGLILLSPWMLLIAIIIKLTSPGPVIFSQERVGLNGRPFRMYKFRSMVQDAEARKSDMASLNEMDGPVFKIKNDPRITPFGHFLRKSSLDELPQLWNVLVRDMSLVGPRPPLPSEVNLYNPKHRKRLSVRPGITCIWQISGRSDVNFDRWMDMDIEYIDNWSFWLDLQILFKTVPVVLLRKGSR